MCASYSEIHSGGPADVANKSPSAEVASQQRRPNTLDYGQLGMNSQQRQQQQPSEPSSTMMTSYVADDLIDKIKLASPISVTDDDDDGDDDKATSTTTAAPADASSAANVGVVVVPRQFVLQSQVRLAVLHLIACVFGRFTHRVVGYRLSPPGGCRPSGRRDGDQ